MKENAAAVQMVNIDEVFRKPSSPVNGIQIQTPL